MNAKNDRKPSWQNKFFLPIDRETITMNVLMGQFKYLYKYNDDLCGHYVLFCEFSYVFSLVSSSQYIHDVLLFFSSFHSVGMFFSIYKIQHTICFCCTTAASDTVATLLLLYTIASATSHTQYVDHVHFDADINNFIAFLVLV